MEIKWIVLFCFIIILKMSMVTSVYDEDNNFDSEERPQVEVRAVFINCEPEGASVASDSDSTRFEREELFKHSVLRDCNKKLALTVKITSEPDSSGDEYLPIEHVFEGANKKRIRLLDPYILRLRREPPLQAYKLRRVDTISGILVDAEGRAFAGKHIRSRIEREISGKDTWTLDHEIHHQQSYLAMTPLGTNEMQSTSLSVMETATHQTRSCDNEYNSNIVCTNTFNTTLSKRSKRSVHNIVVQEATDDNKQWKANVNYYRISDADGESVTHGDVYEDRSNDDVHRKSVNSNHKKETARISNTQLNNNERSRQKKMLRSKMRNDDVSKSGKNKFLDKMKTISPSLRTKDIRDRSTVTAYERGDEYRIVDAEESERDYAVYEIGNPELWYTVHVQLFEKLSTPDGKTVWNDLTKGEQASVSSMSPEWTGQDLNVRYRPAEWIPREEFSLPSASLCLLAPIKGADSTYNNNSFFNSISEDGGYIVVPEEDVMGLKDEDSNLSKRNENSSGSEYSLNFGDQNEVGRRRVVVRTSRALLRGNEEKVNIAFQGSDKYLTLPHRRPHHAQIDLEARADENELVRVGASGRIAIAVADSTRRTRTIITLQVGNTGLAAARFRAATRDCGPALTDLMNESGKSTIMAGPVLIPPRHIRTLRLELPFEIPIDVAHCSVTLINDEEKSVAVREVAIKKGDRCFCVWHCDCVCMTEDPKLLCREMAESRQSAAGLSRRDRTRHARSACYENVITLNVFVIITGVIMALLFLGCIKAVLGIFLRCVGSFGLEHMVQMPRKINCYYEKSLKCRTVEYDCEGYPVHPDTRERTVRFISRPMEFILNVIFFVSVPCVIIYDAMKQLCTRCKNTNTQNGYMMSNKSNTKKCFSSQDMQGLAMRWRRRRGGLRRWMTPQAQDLSKELWKDGLSPVKCEVMRPLLRDARQEVMPIEPHERDHDSCVDSEQDDTDYVLTQMQKSRESLSLAENTSRSSRQRFPGHPRRRRSSSDTQSDVARYLLMSHDAFN